MIPTTPTVHERLDALKTKAAAVLTETQGNPDVAVFVIVNAFLDVQQETQDRIFAELAQIHTASETRMRLR
jgi:hypothetical protein